MKRPEIKVGEEITIFDNDVDAESDQELNVTILNQEKMCWHFIALDEKTGQHYSLFVQADGKLWRIPFTSEEGAQP